MFGDIGFFELAIIGAVALIILGPERLPGAARTAGHFIGKARRMIFDAKADLKRELEQHEMYHEVNKIKKDVTEASHELKQNLSEKDLAGLQTVKRDLEDTINPNSEPKSEPKSAPESEPESTLEKTATATQDETQDATQAHTQQAQDANQTSPSEVNSDTKK